MLLDGKDEVIDRLCNDARPNDIASLLVGVHNFPSSPGLPLQTLSCFHSALIGWLDCLLAGCRLAVLLTADPVNAV